MYRRHSAQSTQLNKSRLRLLQRREEHIQDLFQNAREALLELSKDEGRYVQLLEGIIIQVRIFIPASHQTVIPPNIRPTLSNNLY